MKLTLPWFPPAPAPGPASILQLPTHEWALEPKIDGIRVIWFEGRAYARHGPLLSLNKGADRLIGLLRGIPQTLDGEWLPGQDTFVAFDLPECSLGYDGRRAKLVELIMGNLEIETCPDSPIRNCSAALSMPTKVLGVRVVASYTTCDFQHLYAGLCYQGAEGVVLKSRNSLYTKQFRPNVQDRVWLKRRFRWE